jgi:hypothetical protein
MTFVIGIVGFVAGFCLAILILNIWLKDVPKEDLLQNRGLQVKYGLLTWGAALFIAWLAVHLYRIYISA